MALMKQLEMTVFGQLVTGLKSRQKKLQKKLQRQKGQATAVAAS